MCELGERYVFQSNNNKKYLFIIAETLPQEKARIQYTYSALQNKNTVHAYFTNKQILPLALHGSVNYALKSYT